MKQFLLAVVLLISLNGFTQEQCGTDEMHSHKMNTDLEYRHHYYSIQEQIQTIIENGVTENRGGGEPYIIPVVVHVIHLGEPVGSGSNISDAQIIGAIDGLNERFANLIGNGLDVQMTFCLAKKDPDGCPTNGIVRVNGSGVLNYAEGGITRGGKSECSDAAEDEAVKDLSKWSVSQYYNIWVVHTICGGWAGYAYYPWGGAYDGAVMHKTYMAYQYTTLTHEIGHAFNLPHTFDGDEDGTTCPLNTNCSNQGDRVCDTPPHKVGDCGSSNPCSTEGIWDNSRRNYMSYCGSTNRFTQGQKERMHAAVLVQPRLSLLSSSACQPSDFATTSLKLNVSCIGFCDGSISVEPSCPGEYTYLWSNGEEEASIAGLCPGNYSVTIHEAISSTEHNMSFIINEGLSVSSGELISVTDETEFCEGESITLNSMFAGTYSWSTGETSSSIEVSESGTYSLSVTTPQGCQFSSTPVEVTVYPNPEVDLTIPPIVNYMTTPFELTTGVPAGGVYSGSGVSEGFFYPALAGVGTHLVYYSYTSEDGCTVQVERTIVVEPFVGVEGFSESNDFLIYPNPNNGSFYLSLPHRTDAIVSCHDAAGKLIFIQSIPSSKVSDNIPFQLPQAAAGLYFVRVVTENQVLVKMMYINKEQ